MGYTASVAIRTFGGDLGILGLANLLQAVTMSQSRGILSLTNGNQKAMIQFCAQGIRLVSGAGRALPLGRILIRSGKITNEQLEEMLADQRRSGQRLGDLILEEGLVSEADMHQALREQVAEEIYELFAWDQARFYFAESDSEVLPSGAGPLAMVLLDSNLLSLMVEAARRADEMAKFRSELPVDQLVPVRLDGEVPFDDLGVSKHSASELLSMIDGKRSIDQIVHESSFPKFTVLSTLYELKQRGLLAMEAGAAAEASGPASGPSVLVVGRHPEFRKEAAAQLLTGGFAVIEADAWAAAEPQVESSAGIVVDISVDPDEMLAVCEQISKPFIVVYDAGQGMDTALQTGARYVLVKPVPEKLLLERLAQLK
jgi:CheY-like chemotaxis protein